MRSNPGKHLWKEAEGCEQGNRTCLGAGNHLWKEARGETRAYHSYRSASIGSIFAALFAG